MFSSMCIYMLITFCIVPSMVWPVLIMCNGCKGSLASALKDLRLLQQRRGRRSMNILISSPGDWGYGFWRQSVSRTLAHFSFYEECWNRNNWLKPLRNPANLWQVCVNFTAIIRLAAALLMSKMPASQVSSPLLDGWSLSFSLPALSSLSDFQAVPWVSPMLPFWWISLPSIKPI